MPREYSYIERFYGLHFRRGDRVTHMVTKKSGEVRPEDHTQGHYVQVRFDGQRHALPCHPQELVSTEQPRSAQT